MQEWVLRGAFPKQHLPGRMARSRRCGGWALRAVQLSTCRARGPAHGVERAGPQGYFDSSKDGGRRPAQGVASVGASRAVHPALARACWLAHGVAGGPQGKPPPEPIGGVGQLTALPKMASRGTHARAVVDGPGRVRCLDACQFGRSPACFARLLVWWPGAGYAVNQPVSQSSGRVVRNGTQWAGTRLLGRSKGT